MIRTACKSRTLCTCGEGCYNSASAMERSPSSLLGVVVGAIAVCFATCVAAAAAEQDRTQGESVSPEVALARVNAARSAADPLVLEQALTALGDAYLRLNQHARAEAAYTEAVQSAEAHGGRETERVLAPLIGLSTTYAKAGHHHDAVPLLQRAVSITRAQFGMFDMR